jgi:hypothetical protein
MARAGDVGKGALAGAGTGAAIGSTVGPYGTLIGGAIGGVVGGIGGWFSGNDREEGEAAQRNALTQSREQLVALAARQRQQREADLQRALGYFAPVQGEIDRLYGSNVPNGPAVASPMAPVARPGLNNNTALGATAAPYFKGRG